MLEVIDLFKEQGTVDDIGIGTIRDALSDALFPGSSVLHTRLRYVLFVPWLLQRAAAKGTPAAMSASFRRAEFDLIESLLRGGETQGVIGNRARRGLKLLPSQAYWASLSTWRILVAPTSVEGFFRRQHDHRQLARRTAQADDVEARELLPGTGLDPELPTPPPDLLAGAVLTLRAEEEEYLSSRLATAAQNTAFSWLIHHQPATLPASVWDVDNLGQAPSYVTNAVDHARRFHTAIYGAALLYNLLLAERSHRDDLADDYRQQLDGWQDELAVTDALQGWDRLAWWATIHRNRPLLRPATRTFVDTWIDRITANPDVANDPHLRRLIANRERLIKGGRARLVNQAALDRWGGSSGLGRLDFRWGITRSHLSDLYDAREPA